jgi:hypothetical protein
VNFLNDKFFGLSEQLSSQNGNSSGAISNLFILSLGYIDKYLCCRIVNMNGFQDCGAIISHSDDFLHLGVANTLQNLIHALGSKGSLNKVSDRNGTDEGLHPSNLSPVF